MADLPDGWKSIALGDAAQWLSGGTPRTSEPSYWNGDIPWISAASLTNFYIKDSDRRVTELGAANGTRLVDAGTVLFVVRGMSLKTEFRIGIAQRRVAFGQDCKALIALPGIDPYFLAYALKARTAEILAMVDEAGHGTGRLQTDRLQHLPLALPPLDEQQAIVEVLSALDDKIAVNERIASTADQLIRLHYLQSVSDAEGVIRIDELGKLIRDVVSVDELGEHENYIALEHIPRRSVWLQGWESAEKVTSTKNRFGVGDILFGKLRPYFHKVGIASIEGVCSTDILVVRPVRNDYRGWLLAALSSDEVVAHASAVADGTRMPRVRWADLAGYEVPWVGQERASRFNQLFDSLFRRVVSAYKENRALRDLRDTLLPKLMSGELRVREAEKIVEDAV